MRNKNKTALMAEEILKKHSENSAKCEVIYNKTHEAIIDAMQEFASLQTKDKDKEIEQCKNLANIQQKRWIERNEKLQSTIESQEKDKLIKANDIAFKDSVKRNQQTIKLLQSTIESQQKEIEELKTSIEGVFGWREKNHHLTISEKQLKSQLSEVTKERDELRVWNKAIVSLMNEHYAGLTIDEVLKLTPTKE